MSASDQPTAATAASNAMPAAQFDRFAAQECRRWAPRSIEIVRALLVDSRRVSEVAAEFSVTMSHATVLRSRFLARMRRSALVKVPADAYMRTKLPEGPAVLQTFRAEIKQLVKGGYSQQQIVDFLHANDVQVSSGELTTFLGAMNENIGSGQPKGGRR